jgi:four helix bundle protein
VFCHRAAAAARSSCHLAPFRNQKSANFRFVMSGLALALAAGVAGFRSFKEIGAWKRAYELKAQVLAICRRSSFQRDERLRGQLLDAARSGPRNIAEGFARWHHREFARFTRIAKASEVELLNHFIEARDSGHITEDERLALNAVARRAIKAAVGLIRYLENTPDVG